MGAVQNQVFGKELLKVQVGNQTKNLLVLRGNGSTNLFDVHPLVEGFNREQGTNLTVVSHKVADVAQTVGDTWRSLPVYPVDGSVAYEKPGTKLGKEIVYAAEGEPRVVLATGKYKGERDVALVTLGVTSADFKRDGNSMILDIPDSRLIAVPNFSGPNGWYMPHAETGVPHGGQVEASQDARYLWRLNTSSYVGLLVRGDVRQLVVADGGASDRLGVVAEVPEGDVAKIEALITPVAAPQANKKTTIEVVGVSVDELRGMLERFRQDLETLGSTTKDELLAAGRKLEDVFSGATLKE